MKKPILIAAGVLALGALVALSMMAGGKGKGTKVFTEAAARRAITQTVKASGQIQPRVKVNISAHVIGKIEKLYVVEGQSIATGQPFLELEKQAFQAERDNYRAQVAKSESEVRQAAISLSDQEVRLARAQRLSDEGIASPEALEAARLGYESARLRAEQARESVTQARALLVKAEDDLRKTTIYSPITGRVIALNAEAGEVVVSGTMNNPASVIGTIADMSEILAEIDVDETEIVHLELDQSATVRVDALPDSSYRGTVVELGSSGYAKATQPDVTFFRVKLLLESPDPALRPGMSARADIEVATHHDAIVIPIQSVLEKRSGDADPAAATASPASAEQSGPVVFVADSGRATMRAVRTGISDATHVEIVEGLEPGEQVVSGPYRILRRIKDGEAIQITRPDLEKDADAGEKDKEKS